MIRRYPVMPVIGGGMQRLQPVPVEQVAAGFARAVGLRGDGQAHLRRSVAPMP